MKITILAVGSEAQYQPTFDTAYQYLKKETADLSAELSYAICRPEAAELFAALRTATGQSEAVVLLLSPEPAAVSTELRVVCSGLERTASVDAALQRQLETRAARMGLTLGYEQLADLASFPAGACGQTYRPLWFLGCPAPRGSSAVSASRKPAYRPGKCTPSWSKLEEAGRSLVPTVQ